MPPRISLVIPARNEEKVLPRLLETVRIARDRFPGDIEVIVADNVSTDATARIASEWGAKVVSVTRRNIGAVRNGGAAAATGELLVFVDSDHRLHPDTFVEIDRVMSTGTFVAGCSGVDLERKSIALYLTLLMLMPMLLLLNFDTGVTWERLDDFRALGGYDERLSYAEDVELLWRLRKLGRSRRQSITRHTRIKCIGSVRKFDVYGDWHYITMFVKFPFLLLFGRRQLDDFAKRYWYEDLR